MMSRIPCGSWPSPIGSENIAAGTLRISQPRIDRQEVYWLEARPDEGGRQRIMRAGARGTPEEITPATVNVRSRVHEYGGGEYRVRDGRLFYVDAADQGIHTLQRRITPAGPRYADLDLSPDGRWLVAVQEQHRDGAEPINRVVTLPTDASGAPRPVASGWDFVSTPRFSADGRWLAFAAWKHPNMPWDGTELLRIPWGPDGPEGRAQVVAGGARESVLEPCFSPAGVLTFVSDRSGWWNLHQLRDSGVVPLCPRQAEFAAPPWVFGLSSYAFIDERRILCSHGRGGSALLSLLDLEDGSLRDLELPYSHFEGVGAAGNSACFVGASPTRAAELVRMDLESGECDILRRELSFELAADWISEPEELELASAAGRTSHAFFYAPRGAAVEPAPGERPPMLVRCHGGPTAACSPGLSLAVQYWTSRGFAVLDVNYAGSTGYGRAYRELLYGQWGVADVEDCVRAGRVLADSGRVDPGRLAIRGGSAGGYTALCALTFHDTFHAGASHYGIGDLEALVRDTHKFESRYTERLVAPYPEGRAVYRQRSPIHFTDRLDCPVIFFQGLEDRVVPPSQAEAMVAALAARGVSHAHVTFPGEQHGFRRGENIRTALDGELYFYSRVFGFEAEVRPPQVEIRCPPAGAW